jgi:hypothetical protein
MLNAGQVIGPHYQKVFNGIALPFCKQLAHGILRGTRLLLISLFRFIPYYGIRDTIFFVMPGYLQHCICRLLHYPGCILALENTGCFAVAQPSGEGIKSFPLMINY